MGLLAGWVGACRGRLMQPPFCFTAGAGLGIGMGDWYWEGLSDSCNDSTRNGAAAAELLG